MLLTTSRLEKGKNKRDIVSLRKFAKGSVVVKRCVYERVTVIERDGVCEGEKGREGTCVLEKLRTIETVRKRK